MSIFTLFILLHLHEIWIILTDSADSILETTNSITTNSVTNDVTTDVTTDSVDKATKNKTTTRVKTRTKTPRASLVIGH